MTMTKTFDCVECGASAPYGRLSCPSCGALLASVTGGRRSAVRVAQVEAEPESPVAAAAPVREHRPRRRSRGRYERMPRRPRNASALRHRSWTQPSRRRPPRARLRPRRPRRSRRRRPTPDRRLAAQAPKPAPKTAQPPRPSRPRPPQAPADADPRRGPEPNPELRADASRSGAERRLDPSTDARPRRRGGSRPPPPPPRKAAPTPQRRSSHRRTSPPRTRRRSPPRSGPRAGPRATRRPRPRPLRARTSAPATPARSQTARPRLSESRPNERPSSRSSSRPRSHRCRRRPGLPSRSQPPTLTARPYQRHLAFELDPVDTGPPPSAYRPPSQAVLMATATAAANDAARAHPAADGSGAGGAEATMTRDSTWWLNTIPDPARFVEIAGWFVVVGAAMSLLGFLLPWSRVVIGATDERRLLRRLGAGQPDPSVRLPRPARRSSPWPSAAGPSRPGSRRASWVSSSADCSSALPGRTWSARSVPTSV